MTFLPDWNGKTIVVIASGPSLNLKDIRHVARARLADRCRVIAVNDAIFVAWFADWLHACDGKWWGWYPEAHEFKGIKTAFDAVPNVVKLIDSGMRGFDDRPGYCCNGGTSAYQAVHLAAQAGARKIALLGVDLKVGENGDRHFFGYHPDKGTPTFETMIDTFNSLVPSLAARGNRVVNCSPGSALSCFDKSSIGAALGE
jgi:hypothetical protein